MRCVAPSGEVNSTTGRSSSNSISRPGTAIESALFFQPSQTATPAPVSPVRPMTSVPIATPTEKPAQRPTSAPSAGPSTQAPKKASSHLVTRASSMPRLAGRREDRAAQRLLRLRLERALSMPSWLRWRSMRACLRSSSRSIALRLV